MKSEKQPVCVSWIDSFRVFVLACRPEAELHLRSLRRHAQLGGAVPLAPAGLQAPKQVSASRSGTAATPWRAKPACVVFAFIWRFKRSALRRMHTWWEYCNELHSRNRNFRWTRFALIERVFLSHAGTNWWPWHPQETSSGRESGHSKRALHWISVSARLLSRHTLKK